MAVSPIENIRGFVSSRPPLVVFILCLGLFGVMLMSLAYYVKETNEIRNPDISQDWNLFLENFADIEFCIVGDHNDTAVSTAQPTTQAPRTTTDSRSREATTPPTTQEVDTGLRNYSVSMLLTVFPTRDFLTIPHNLTYLSGSVLGSKLGIRGAAGEEMLNVTIHLPYEWNTTRCTPKGCDRVNIYTCVHFQAPAIVFPSTKSPEVCENMNDTGVEYHARMMAQPPSKNMFTSYYCRAKPLIKVHYTLNPTLTVLLTLRDRSVINLHLLHTSYFLFVMVVMLLCYALIKGKPLSVTYAHAEKNASLASSAKI